MSSRRNLVARGRPGATHVGWSRPDADDGPRQVSWLAALEGNFATFRASSSFADVGLAAYSCGHSAGFCPASLFTDSCERGTLGSIRLGAGAEACQFRPSRLWAADLFEAGRNQPKSQEIQDEDR